MSDTDEKKPETTDDLPDGVVLRDHVYDGIQEYDQKLPNWWLFTLYIMVVLYVIYWFLYYQTNMFRTDYETVDAAIERIEQEKAAKLKQKMAELDNDVFWELSRNGVFVSAGQKTFEAACYTCHGKALDGKGPGGVQLAGVPLNDSEWIHGGEPMQIFNIVMNGSPNKEKGMVAWNNLGTDKVVEVVAYVLSKHEPPAKTEEPVSPAEDEAPKETAAN